MTRKILLIAGVAGLALAAPVSAEKGGRGGAEQAQQTEARKGGGQQAQRPQREERQVQAQRVERPQRVERVQRAERPQRMERQVARIERERIERPQRIERQAQRMERRLIERPQRIERQQQRVERQAERAVRPQRQRVERIAQPDRQRIDRQAQRIERRAERRDMLRATPRFERQQDKAERRMTERLLGSRDDDRRAVRAARFDGRGAPLFDSRDMRPMKPFKAKFDKADGRELLSIGERVERGTTLASVPLLYASRYVDAPDYYYRYDNDLGYVYRIDRDDRIVQSMIPLFGGYGIGDPWPATYYSSYVPLGYRDYYYDTSDYYYRNDGYGIYQVDAGTQLITALVALLTGQSFGVGQMLPASYGAYNVPLDYRTSYYDTDDSWYRYGDGFIYQVDPDSRRIAARYPIYADEYYVGDPWPVAYPDYNVPAGYQSLYYDTPQYHYRYANGGIYQVDPTNQMILALVALLSGDQFSVGQQLPSGYDMYNVPLDYRDRYADSGDNWYRYADGYVYRVDPGSGLIEEAIPVYA